MPTQEMRLTPLEMSREIPGSNHARLLQLLYEKRDLSRADLARAVGFTKATVSSLIADMIQEGLVIETRQRSMDGPGRPAVDLNIDRSRWCVIAVDLSRVNEIRGALVNLAGEVQARAAIRIDGAMGEVAVERTLRLISELQDAGDRRLLGIGVSVPGIVDLDGRVIASHNLGWSSLPLRQRIEEQAGLPTCVANDANTAALAERNLPGFQDNLILVKIGHGVGAGIIVNGNLLHGSRFTAGEIGHVATGDGPLCVCGRRGCLEATLTVPKIEAHLRTATSAEGRAEVLHSAGTRLAIAVAPLVGGLGLEAVVLADLPHEYGPLFVAAMRDALKPRLTEDLLSTLQLRTSSLGDDIELQGAVFLVLSRVLGVA
jgi:predicted NBD/HSP70 family sugar kinase